MTLQIADRHQLPGCGVGFGLGFAVTIDTARSMMPGSVGEYYWGGMFSTGFFVDPAEQLAMVFMPQL